MPSAMLQMITGYWVSQCIWVAAKFGVADALAKGPLAIDTLAAQTGAHVGNLYRVMRALASIGIFAEDSKKRFKLTPMAQFLKSDHPLSQRDFALMILDEWNWSTWGALDHAVATGENPFLHVKGLPAFDYLKGQPEKEVVFARAMKSISIPQLPMIAGAYPFGELKTLVDVGGSHGHLLAAILQKHKKLKGILYDLPQVVEAAAQTGFVTAPGLKGRGSIQAGSFFDSVPEGADGYIMKYIIHDWDDEKCIRILTNCREAMAKDGRVIVCDSVIKSGNAADPAKFMDINMMVVPDGKERSKEEFQALFAASGLKLKRIIPTESMMSIIEAVRA